MMGAGFLRQGDGDDERMICTLELPLIAASRSLLLLTITTVSQLRSCGWNDGSSGVVRGAAPAADDDDTVTSLTGVNITALASEVDVSGKTGRGGVEAGEGNGFGNENEAMAKGAALLVTWLMAQRTAEQKHTPIETPFTKAS